MEANARHLERIFDQTITYQVPLFQRPYVWTEEKNWQPLWDDIQALLDRHLRGLKVHPHFLGAVVLEQLANPTGAIESRQVIDGQQRFTTLQLFMIAGRDHAQELGHTKYVERLGDLVANRRTKIDHDDEAFKVWPTNSDRAAFRLVHEAQSLPAVDKALKAQPDRRLDTHTIVGAYRFFHARIGEWLEGKLDDVDDASAVQGKSVEERLESLWQIVRGQLQVVVIDLDKDDETQVIFETLNARGEDLLPADLIKNFLFRRCVAAREDVEKLYAKHWRVFESDFWREEVKQGRLNRPRIDVFVQHYLTLMTREDVRSSHLFSAFKEFEARQEAGERSSVRRPSTPAGHIESLARYGAVFQSFYGTTGKSRLATFLRRLDAMDTSTAHPFLLHACAELLPDGVEQLSAVVDVLESFLVRRMICGLSPKNYNRLFVELIRATEEAGEISAAVVSSHLGRATGDSTRFPTDEEVRRALFNMPLYGRLPQYKLRVVLEGLDAHAHDAKSEHQALPENLTIEHVMPQKWETHWPVPVELASDPIAKLDFTQKRDRAVNLLGNLTLITGSLNPSLSNGAWAAKRPELLKFSKLNLTRYFHGKDADVWDEAAIEKRTEHLFQGVRAIWPGLRV